MDWMAKTITVSVDAETDAKFRMEASRRFGKKKGYLGKAFAEAMEEWARKRDKDLEREALKLMKEGIKMKKWAFNRDEAHER